MDETRLGYAKKLGADVTLRVTKTDTTEQLTEQVLKEFDGESPDVTMDCNGFESSVRLAIAATKSGGVIVLVGMGSDEVKVPLVKACIRELKIKGVFRYCNE